jgi:NAD(P)-dependent dehydrogenase (short-subunit alcohol dehydrogenase family)
MPDLNGSVALVTGGGSGLGAELCNVLAGAGARVIAADISLERATRTADSLRAAGQQVQAIELDVSEQAAVDAAFDELARNYGSIDILVTTAGTDVTLPFDELPAEDWERVLGVNLRGPFLLAHAAYPLMKAQGRGQIVNITSTAAKRVWPNASAYHASKWGLLGLSHALHVEGRSCGVKVTAVVAGGMRTPFILERFPETDPGLLQDPRTVAEAIRFVLTLPPESVIAELMVLPMRETSWP